MELGMFFHFDLPIYKQGWHGNLVGFDLKCPDRVNHVLIMEDIACGERILECAVEALAKDGTW